MANIAEFVEAPSCGGLNKFMKDQLLRVSDHYKIDISDKRANKEVLKSEIKAFLSDLGVLTLTEEEPCSVLEEKWPGESVDGSRQWPGMVAAGLTFEQQRELFLLQSQERIDMERLWIEQTRLDIEKTKLELIKEGKLAAGEAGVSDARSWVSRPSDQDFDIVRNLHLVPKFNEKDPETFFSLFERVAEVRNWPESARALMLQCLFTGRAQEAYVSLNAEDSKNYTLVKKAVLRAFEMVPDAYRKRFCTWRKGDKQTYLEFASDLAKHFDRWCAALGVNGYEGLRELIVLEQLKNTLPEHISNYISDQKVK